MSNCNSCPSKGNCNTNANSCGVVNHPYNKIKKVIGVMSGKGGLVVNCDYIACKKIK